MNRSVFILACLLLLTLGLTSCAPEEIAPQTTPNSLESILKNGVKTATDYDVLVKQNVYPFNYLSEQAVVELKTGTIFRNNQIKAFASYQFFGELTQGECMSLLTTIFHRHPLFENTPEVAFRKGNDRAGVPPVTLSKDGDGSARISFGFDWETVDELEDCIVGGGACNFIDI